MRRLGLLGAVALVLAGCGGSGSGSGSGSGISSAQQQFRGTELSPPSRAPGFALPDPRTGKTVSLASQRGDWVVVTFLYTHCPDVCPLIAANVNRAIGTPAGRRARLRVLAVSVDPARDTAAAVRTYAKQHRLVPSFHFLIGARAALARVWREYHVATQPGAKGTVTHSTFEILVDPQGKERLIYDATITTADLVADLTKLNA